MNPDRYLRSFDVLDLLAQHKEGLRLTEIKDALGLPVSSVHNMLQTMVGAEVAAVSETLRYTIGPRAVSMALRTLRSLDIRTAARRHLEDLVKDIGDDVYLAMRVGKRVFYADRVYGSQRISLDIRLGGSLSLHCTATGKLFAAFDPKLAAQTLAGRLPRVTPSTITDPQQLEREYKAIRAAGFSRSAGEAVEGIVGYAVPIQDGSGKLAAAIHVSVLSRRATKAHERTLLAAAHECAEQIARHMGNTGNSNGARDRSAH